ncbi:MAG: DNA repair protein RadA [Spirochaetes bacterium RBG_16_49_21]|nr:MAG: DNA repair protein RadA [Spirochaetes bacterium RBG_16_49_21]
MARQKKLYICTSCGTDFPKWQGKCSVCNEWNTIVEAQAPPAPAHAAPADVIPLAAVEYGTAPRIQTGIGEFNLVCGGGIVPGSVILIGGEPGIGKSTLALQIAGFFNALYISGEESPLQLRLRAERLGCNVGNIHISTTTNVDQIISLAESGKPECLIIDSIQMLYSSSIPGLKGSVSQIRESASRLAEAAKRLTAVLILIGHITKDGSIAGPKLLEHLVDTVLYFEGNFSRDFRILRAFKNRYGSVNEIGLFKMEERGLIEVTDKNKIFLSPYLSSAPGNAVSAAVEGSRIILFEVQSLVTFSTFPNPRRMADGFDLNRLILIIAVLEKHAGMKLNSSDVFINVSGGFQINDTAADLAVAVSIASSLKNRAVRQGFGFLGEISLSGEVRPVSLCGRRIQEFKHSGFTTLILPEAELPEAKAAGFDGEVIGIHAVQDALDRLF